MNSITVNLWEFLERRHLIPKGVWLVLLAYSLVVFSSPMPAKITWLEIVMGSGLLMGGILLAGSVIREARQQRSAKWCLGLTALLCLFPLLVGLMRGNALSDMARDIFPFIFLLVVPILLTYSASSANRAAIRTLMVTILAFVGICSAIAFFVGALNLFGSMDQMVSKMRGGLAQVVAERAAAQGAQGAQAELRQDKVSGGIWAAQGEQAEFTRTVFLKLYDPAALFASIFLCAWGMVLMVGSWRGWLPGMILAGVGAFIAYGFMITGLRSYVALFVLAILMICLTQLRERKFYVRFLPVLIVASVLIWPQIWAVLQLLWIKQQAAGTNGKAEEWLAVITTILAAPQTMLFGIGWGGTFENPILAETTRFTHSMLSFYLLKTGVIGLGMLLAVIGLLLARSQKTVGSDPLDIPRQIFLVSCMPPLLIGVLFEPTYKMLSYGVILALFVLALPSFEKRIR